MLMTEYETTVIMRPDVSGDAIEATLDKVRSVMTQSGGKLLAINHWGKKKLAFEIAKHTRAIYVHTHFLGGNTLVAELERNLRISDVVLRYMTIRLADGVGVDEREVKAYVAPQYDSDDTVEETLQTEDDLDDEADLDGDDEDAEDEEGADV